MADENQPSVPFFTYETKYKTIATQTPINYFSDVECLNPQVEFDLPPDFDGSGPTLLHQYYANTKYFIDHIDPSTLSTYKQEILSKVKQHSIFQSKIFNSINLPDGSLPPNTFDNLKVSLYLIIYSDHYTFKTAIQGIEINGDLNDDVSHVLSYVSQGLLPPCFLEKLKDLNLVWYDGGLICEISDQRKASPHPLRVLMRINPIDVTKCGFDIEQEYLLNRFPLLCLDPDTRVSKLTREVVSDSQRWQPNPISGQTPAEFLQSEYPSIFIERLEPKKARIRTESKHTEAELRKMLMIKLGIIKEENNHEKETIQDQSSEQENQTIQQQSNESEKEQLTNSDFGQDNSTVSGFNSVQLSPSFLSPSTSESSVQSTSISSNNPPSNQNVNLNSAPGFSYNSKTTISQQIVKLMQQQKIAQFMDSAMNNVNLNKALKFISASSSNPDLKSGSNQMANADQIHPPAPKPGQDQSNDQSHT